jgi:DNA-binding GntR family transcriptional regulator
VGDNEDVLDRLREASSRQERTSVAEWAARVLRDGITEGLFPPGERLPEDALGGVLKVSRNTLREAFRLLTHERLVVHELNRGVFVRVLETEDLRDIYRVRRLIEGAALRSLRPPPYPLEALEQAVADGRKAAQEGRWRDVGTANIGFHKAIVALAGSPRTDELMRGILAELRLVFHVMADPRAFHEPYVDRNQEILRTLQADDAPGAARLLAAYLDDSERQLVQRYAGRTGAPGSPG